MKLKLSQVVDTDLNTRTTPLNKEHVARLAASIKAIGLIEPIALAKAEKDKYAVIAGRHRLAALKQIGVKELVEGEHFKIIKGDETALVEASTAENLIRLGLSPLEECDAFRKMIEGGATVKATAAHFAVREVYVRQRLQLANLCETGRKLVQGGQMALETAQALSALPADQQEALLQENPVPTAWQVRQMIEKRAFAVGNAIFDRKLYKGAIMRDLFAADDDAAYFADRDQAMELQRAAIEKRKAIRLKEGWTFVEVVEGSFDHAAFMQSFAANKKERKRRKLGVVIELYSDGFVREHEAMQRVEDARAEKAARRAAEKAASKDEAEAPAITGPMAEHMLNYRNLAMAKALVEDPHAIKVALILELGQKTRPVAKWRGDEFRKLEIVQAHYDRCQKAIDMALDGKEMTFENLYALKPVQLDNVLAATYSQLMASEFPRGDRNQDKVAAALGIKLSDTYKPDAFMLSRIGRAKRVELLKQHGVTLSDKAKIGEQVDVLLAKMREAGTAWIPEGCDFRSVEPDEDDAFSDEVDADDAEADEAFAEAAD